MKRQLDLIPNPDEASKQALKRAVSDLNQGKEASCVRQKYIRIADRSHWGVVVEYEADELASDSDDEKRLFRASKEQETKKRQASADFKKRPRQEGAAKQPSSSDEPRPPASRTKPISDVTLVQGGVTCGHMPKGGHQQQYPLCQPVVSGLDPPACHVYNNMLCVEKGVNRMPGPSNGTDQQIAGKGSGVDST